MKKLMNSRPFAAACLVVVIVLSVCLGGIRSVKKLEKKAYEAYYTDFALYGEADNDIKKMSRYASMLSAVCVAADCASADFASAADAFDKAAGDPYLDQTLYNGLFDAATVSYNLLINHPDTPEQQSISAKQYYYEIDAAMRRLANNSGYNEAAARYNKALRSFPLSLLLKNADQMIVFD